jgi:hypothetical protein
MTAKGLIVQNSFRVGLLIYSFFRNYVSASANVAEQRPGSPYGPVRGTAGSIAGLPLRKPVALGRCWLFLQPNNSQRSDCQIRNARTLTASLIPSLGNRREAPSRSFQSRSCHVFHLFYQVQIRLGSPIG